MILQTEKLAAMNLKQSRVLWVCGAMLLIAGALVVAVFAPSAREPVYQGRGLGEWMDLANGLNPQIAQTTAWASVQAIGPKGLPWLLAELQARDSRLRQGPIGQALGLARLAADRRRSHATMGIALLGDAALPAIPELASRLGDSNRSVSARFALDAIARGGRFPTGNRWPQLTNVIPLTSAKAHAAVLEAFLEVVRGTNAWARVESLYALGMYSEDASRIAPAVLSCVRDETPQVRQAAAWVLGRLARDPVPVIPELIRLLDDPAAQVRRNAAYALGRYFRQAKTAVPRLLEARRDPDPEVRKAANESLDKIDPETAAAIPDLPGFKP